MFETNVLASRQWDQTRKLYAKISTAVRPTERLLKQPTTFMEREARDWEGGNTNNIGQS